jgi:mono/diheme cytochrome c family protein
MIPARMATKPLKITAVLAALGAAGAIAACGEQKIETASTDPAPVKQGAQLFYQRCSGCHTLSAAAAEGSAESVHDVERVDGPNFDQRRETAPQVLYAIRNGGFSGAIMPQNVVTGSEAQAVAAFVAKYSGSKVSRPVTPGG